MNAETMISQKTKIWLPPRTPYASYSPEDIKRMRDAARELEIKKIDDPGWTGVVRTHPASYVFELEKFHIQMGPDEVMKLAQLRCEHLNITPDTITWRMNGQNLGTTKYERPKKVANASKE